MTETTKPVEITSTSGNGQHDVPSTDAPLGVASDALATAPAAATENTATRWITRRRLAKWSRPRPPRDWRWAVTHVGRVLIATGILLFGFVAYQLWGTNLETARAQRALAAEFDELLAAAPPATPSPVRPDPVTNSPDASESTPADENAATTEAAPADGNGDVTIDDDSDAGTDVGAPEVEPPTLIDPADLPEIEVDPGAALARISMPSIGIDEIVVSGVRVDDLKKGPGHFPSTPLPGHLGNSAIAGHRTTYGSPFRNVDGLAPGDEVIVETIQGTFVYRVTGTEIVQPEDSHVVATTEPDVARLTLVSCHPILSASQRIIVYADLDLAVSMPVAAPAPESPPDLESSPESAPSSPDSASSSEPEPAAVGLGELDGSLTGVAEVGSTVSAVDLGDDLDEVFGRGWFHDEEAFAQIGLWGGALILISLGAYGWSRATRRDLVGFVIGIAPFAVASFFFFQNVNRLLPPGL